MPTSQQVMGLSARGWRVHPLHNVDALGVCSCHEGKQCKSPGKHPRIKAWQKAATTDEEVISDWWDRWPKSNVAVVMGPSSGIIDLDCDSQEGEAFIRELFCECEEALETPTFRSARGRHRLYKYTGDLPNSDKGHWKLQGVDVDFKIGNGGLGTYCVFPPSLHSNGALYHWEKSPDDYEVLDLPDLVIAKLHAFALEGGTLSVKGKGRPKEHFERILEGVGEGERNESAASLIGNSIASMADPTNKKQQAIQLKFIESWNTARNNPPLDTVELHATFYSILQRHIANMPAKQFATKPEPTQDDSEQEISEEWSLIRVDADPPYYKLFSPFWDGFVRLTDEEMPAARLVRLAAQKQKCVALENSFRAFWEGSKQTKSAYVYLFKNIKRESAAFDERLENIVAHHLYEHFDKARESDAPDTTGRPVVLSSREIWFQSAYLRNQDRFLSDNQQVVVQILKSVCAPVERVKRINNQAKRFKVLTQAGLDQLRTLAFYGSEEVKEEEYENAHME